METKINRARALRNQVGRRRFMKGLAAGGAALLPIRAALADRGRNPDRISKGDAAMLRFLAAAETLETDAWQQYTELANNNPAYMAALHDLCFMVEETSFAMVTSPAFRLVGDPE